MCAAAAATVLFIFFPFLQLAVQGNVEERSATSFQKVDCSVHPPIQRTFYKRSWKFKQNVLFADYRFAVSKMLNVLRSLY